MSFNVNEHGTNRKLVGLHELLLVVYSNFRRITHRFRDISCFAENHILPTPLVFDLEFKGHAVGIWRRNLAPEN